MKEGQKFSPEMKLLKGTRRTSIRSALLSKPVDVAETLQINTLHVEEPARWTEDYPNRCSLS